MSKDPIEIFKIKKKEREDKLGRKLDKYERTILMDEVFDSLLDGVKIPSEEISDLEITALKD